MDSTKKNESPTAPAPHWKTIALGLLSPAVTIAAVVIALFVLNTNDRKELRVAQRAYLGLKFDLLDETLMKSVFASQSISNSTIKLKIVVTNTGNSPARNVQFPQLSLHSFKFQSVNLEPTQAADIGPKESMVSDISWRLLQAPSTNSRPDTPYELRVDNGFSVMGEVSYVDVFGDSHTRKVCSIFEFSGEDILGPKDCKFAGITEPNVSR